MGVRGPLRELSQHFVLVSSQDTLRDALVALREQDGYPWWILLVVGEDGQVRAARFDDFRTALNADGAAALHRALDDFDAPLAPVVLADKSADRARARALAETHEHGFLVVVDRLPDGDTADRLPQDAEVVGVLVARRTRSTPSPGEPSLFEVADSLAAPREEAGPRASPVDVISDMSDEVGESISERYEHLPGVMPSSPPRAVRVSDEMSPPDPTEITRIERVDGDVVTGDKVIGGDEIHGDKLIYMTPPEHETRDQPRRFEAAFPQACRLGVEQRLWVAVMLPDASSPFTDRVQDHEVSASEEVGVPLPVDGRTGKLKPLDLEVTVTATGFKVEGEETKKLTVWPDGRTVKRWFQLEPETVGEQSVHVEVCVDGRLLHEMALTAEVVKPQSVSAGLFNFSLRIATFSLTLTFAAGA